MRRSGTNREMTFRPIPDNYAGLPLGSLDAVVFDTETTGLNPKSDRIVEIAAVELIAGKIYTETAFSELVNPGIPIPESSTKIHSIDDNAVANAQDFQACIAKFAKWAGPRALIGFSLRFDMSAFESEHRRFGLPWTAPKALDVQELVQALGVELPNFALETIASSLDVTISTRHRALPDAILCAEVFLKIIPLLRGKGVSTFAEAERMCARDRRASSEAISYSGATKPAEAVNIDSFIYRHRVEEVMTSPPLKAVPSMKMREAIAVMVKKRVGALFVSPDSGKNYGIITERDVLQAIHSDGSGALDRMVGEFCSRPLTTIAAKEFLYRAIVEISSLNLKHLGVLNQQDELVGMVTAHDIFGHHTGDGVALGREIETASSPAELGRVWSGLSTVVGSLIGETIEPRDVTAIISREIRALTAKACQLAEAEMFASGQNAPPVPYAMLVFGSGARGESMLAMDQDNGIIFENAPVNGAGQWFLKFGKRTSAILDEAGVRYCDGGVMGSNPEWCQDDPGWRNTIAHWLSRTEPEDLLHADIFFDLMPVHGDSRLAEKLRTQAIQSARNALPFLRRLAMQATSFRSPTGWFGRWNLERGRVDLKQSGIMPIFSAARVVALQFGITSRSTAGRLLEYKKFDNANERAVDDLVAAHGILLGAILRQQIQDLADGRPLGNRVDPRMLDGTTRHELDWALSRVSRVRDIVGTPAFI